MTLKKEKIDLERLRKYEPIYVIGHSNPDLDTIVSSMLISNIFNSMGIKSYYAVLDSGYDIDTYNLNMVNDCIKNYNPFIIERNNIDNYNIFIVDHNDPVQSVGNCSNIIGGIDHHEDSKKLNNILLNNYCCNSLFIYDYFKDKYSFSDEEKYSIYLATLNDTLFYKNSRYKKEQQNIIDSLGVIGDADILLKRYFIEPEFEKGFEYILTVGNKEYSYNEIRFRSCVTKVTNKNQHYISEFKSNIEKLDCNFLGIWMNIEDEKTKVYFKLSDKIIEFNYDFLASRATTVIKDVFKYIDNL